MNRSYSEINEKIKTGTAKVLTALESKEVIKEKGVKYLLENIDVVVCSAFEMHVNALLYLSFGQTDPLIYFSQAYINDIHAYPVGPTDLVLSCVASSIENHEYGGSHVLEELVKGKDIHLKGFGKHLEVFTNKEFETWFNLKQLNQARLILNQAVTQNNIVAANSGDKDINSYMGTLIGKLENSTYNSSSYLNPLINDPFCKTVGIGTKIWIAGSQGFITGHGTNHNPLQKRNKFGIPLATGTTLSANCDINSMNPKWVRGGYLKSFGPVLYIGIGIPVPVLNEEIAHSLSITDDKIHTTIVDFSIPRRTKPIFGQCSYSELRTSTILINNKPTLSAPLSSMSGAIEIAGLIRNEIQNKTFYLSEPIERINTEIEMKKLDPRLGEAV